VSEVLTLGNDFVLGVHGSLSVAGHHTR
jgi:hypothetical protein